MEENEKIDIAVLIERQKVANHRIDDLEEKVSEFIDFKYTVKTLSDAVQDLKVTVKKVCEKDAETYNEIKKYIILSIIGLIIGFLFGKVFK